MFYFLNEYINLGFKIFFLRNYFQNYMLSFSFKFRERE